MARGYDIFDAIEGAPGTYMTSNPISGMSFGFSEDLYTAPWNWIDSAQQYQTFNYEAAPGVSVTVPTPGEVQTTGYNVFEDPLFGTSGFIPELAAAQAEYSEHYHPIYGVYMAFMQAVDALQSAGIQVDPQAA